MDEIVLDGKTYISSKLAAKKSGYAKDYVGQLCRLGKLDCRLVGRSWYVTEASVLGHAGKEAAPQAPQTRSVIEESTIVKPVPAVRTVVHSKKEATTLATWGAVVYEHEEEAMMPVLPEREKIESKNINKNLDLSDIPSRQDTGIKIHRVHSANTSIPEHVSPATEGVVIRKKNVVADSVTVIRTAPQRREERRTPSSIMSNNALIMGGAVALFALSLVIILLQQQISYSQGSFFTSDSFGSSFGYIIDRLGQTR